ncbi:MAG: AraC family ligand binding domain-containing protein [Planctomycetota bacterium]
MSTAGDRDKYIRQFEDGEEYTQPCGPNCEFKTILKKGENGDMNAGFITMEGPTWNEPSSHDKWHQFYLLLKGKGTMRIGEERYAVEAPCIINIPFNTIHALELKEGEKVEYVYVNQHIED